MIKINTIEELEKICNDGNKYYIELSSKAIIKSRLYELLDDDKFILGVIDKKQLENLIYGGAFLIVDKNNEVSFITFDDYAKSVSNLKKEGIKVLFGTANIDYLLNIVDDEYAKNCLQSMLVDKIEISFEKDRELYAKVLHRSIRIAKLIELNSPELVIKNEKLLLLEAVDALLGC